MVSAYCRVRRFFGARVFFLRFGAGFFGSASVRLPIPTDVVNNRSNRSTGPVAAGPFGEKRVRREAEPTEPIAVRAVWTSGPWSAVPGTTARILSATGAILRDAGRNGKGNHGGVSSLLLTVESTDHYTLDG
jgi:hypothetical protein